MTGNSADVFSPGTSGNLIAHIPGTDSSQAVILGGHIDSPNSPGAMDDGSGSVVLLEVARVLNEARLQPPVDLYLAWFGSEELSIYGSAHFAATHQELLDRTTAMLQVDMLGRPVDGINPYLNLVGWSYGRHGDDRLPWPEYLTQKSDQLGLTSMCPRSMAQPQFASKSRERNQLYVLLANLYAGDDRGPTSNP